MAGEALLAEMEALRDRVAGITDTALATRDGLIIKADTVDVDPDNIAAMAAAMIGLARRMAIEAGRGPCTRRSLRGAGATWRPTRSAHRRCSWWWGTRALTRHLYRESRETVEKLNQLITGTDRRQPAGDAKNLRGPAYGSAYGLRPTPP